VVTALAALGQRDYLFGDRCGGSSIVAISKLQGHASDLKGDAHRVRRLGVKVLTVEELYDWYSALPSPITSGRDWPTPGLGPLSVIAQFSTMVLSRPMSAGAFFFDAEPIASRRVVTGGVQPRILVYIACLNLRRARASHVHDESRNGRGGENCAGGK
jgi:hypothetical protein